jgi:hypothetical protein
MTEKEVVFLKYILDKSSKCFQRVSLESSGQYTLTILNSQQTTSRPKETGSLNLSSKISQTLICKKRLLSNFYWILFNRNHIYHDKYICKALSNIILQRLMARLNISSDIIHSLVQIINDLFSNQDVDTTTKFDLQIE